MSLGLVGRKRGMTRIFTDDGAAVPVTVLDVAGNRVTQIKTPESDGYAAVQVTYGKRRARRVNKAQAGHLAKAGVEATKGKGFAGVIARHNFRSNRASHGNSLSHNKPGSISMAQDPGRVFPGKRMPGHYGHVTRTVQMLKVIRVDAARGLLLVHGSVPGADGGHIVVKPAVKVPAKKGE